jgi:hypothetical protein
MARPTISDVRNALLGLIDEQRPKGPTDSPLQQGSILEGVNKRLGISKSGLDLALLTLFHDLMRTGYLAWGHNLNNPNPPFFHVTDRGARALAIGSRDPTNPDGYLGHVATLAKLNPVANSYLIEALECFSSGLFKASAVMVGAAAESLILELRDATIQRLSTLGQALPRGIDDWRVKTVLDALDAFFQSKRSGIPRSLREEFDAYWPAFTQQIRATRNDAGHPVSIDPVTEDSVHAAFLVFPQLARVAQELREWVLRNLK